MKKKSHPMQPLVIAEDGRVRFKENKIVSFLLENGPFDMNAVARRNFTDEDRSQFAQLIGYSASGFGDLSYAKKRHVRQADAIEAELQKEMKKG